MREAMFTVVLCAVVAWQPVSSARRYLRGVAFLQSYSPTAQEFRSLRVRWQACLVTKHARIVSLNQDGLSQAIRRYGAARGLARVGFVPGLVGGVILCTGYWLPCGLERPSVLCQGSER
jgi:hypothetical protein